MKRVKLNKKEWKKKKSSFLKAENIIKWKQQQQQKKLFEESCIVRVHGRKSGNEDGRKRSRKQPTYLPSPLKKNKQTTKIKQTKKKQRWPTTGRKIFSRALRKFEKLFKERLEIEFNVSAAFFFNYIMSSVPTDSGYPTTIYLFQVYYWKSPVNRCSYLFILGKNKINKYTQQQVGDCVMCFLHKNLCTRPISTEIIKQNFSFILSWPKGSQAGF